MLGQQRLGLDVQQICGHGQKLARHVEVDPLHALYALHVLVEHKGDGNVVNIDLVLGDEL